MLVGGLMKKRLLIGTLILTIFLVSLIPASIGAIGGIDGFAELKIIGGDIASFGELGTKVGMIYLLRVTDCSDEIIEGHGKGILASAR